MDNYLIATLLPSMTMCRNAVSSETLAESGRCCRMVPASGWTINSASALLPPPPVTLGIPKNHWEREKNKQKRDLVQLLSRIQWWRSTLSIHKSFSFKTFFQLITDMENHLQCWVLRHSLHRRTKGETPSEWARPAVRSAPDWVPVCSALSERVVQCNPVSERIPRGSSTMDHVHSSGKSFRSHPNRNRRWGLHSICDIFIFHLT